MRQYEQILLRRLGHVYLPESGWTQDDKLATGASLELSQLGYVPSTRLAERFARTSPTQLAENMAAITDTLAVSLGVEQKLQRLPDMRAQGRREPVLHGFASARREPEEHIVFKRLDLGGDALADARAGFVSLRERTRCSLVRFQGKVLRSPCQ